MKKQEQILIHTATFLLQHGFSKVSSDELAEVAGVSKRTLYKYFPSKEILVTATLDQIRQHVTKGFSEIVNSKRLKPLEKFFTIVQYVTESTSKISKQFYRDIEIHYPEFYEKLRKERKDLILSLASTIESGQKNGSFRKDIHPQFAVDFLLVAAEGLINPSELSSKDYSNESAHRMMFTIFLEGLLKNDALERGGKALLYPFHRII